MAETDDANAEMAWEAELMMQVLWKAWEAELQMITPWRAWEAKLLDANSSCRPDGRTCDDLRLVCL